MSHYRNKGLGRLWSQSPVSEFWGLSAQIMNTQSNNRETLTHMPMPENVWTLVDTVCQKTHTTCRSRLSTQKLVWLCKPPLGPPF